MKAAIIWMFAACFASGAVGTSVAKPAAGKRVLDQGMNAGEVVSLVGRPERIEPIKAPEGNAERWTYRRVLHRSTMQRGIDQGTTLAFTGIVVREVPTIEYRLVDTTTYQVTSLLMFEGRLVVGKQWTETRETIVD